MAERSSLNQNIQIGVEATPGVAVAATKRLQSITIEPSPTVEKSNFRPIGQKFQALSVLGKEWTEASISGRATYTELQYLFSSVVNTPVISGGTWVFTPASREDDLPKTFTVEHGSAVRADKFSYGLVTEVGLSFNRSSIDITGSMMGRAMLDNIVMTAAGSVTSPDLIPVIPTQVSVYLSEDIAGIGDPANKLTRAISAEWSLGSRFGPVWVLDAANPSFVNHVEVEPDLSCAMTLQADGQGMQMLEQLRSGGTKFLRIEAIGDEYGTGTPYRLAIDMAIKVSDTGGFSDADGVYAIEFSAIGVHDATWGKAVQITLANGITAL